LQSCVSVQKSPYLEKPRLKVETLAVYFCIRGKGLDPAAKIKQEKQLFFR